MTPLLDMFVSNRDGIGWLCNLVVAPYRLQGALALITTNSTPASGQADMGQR